MEKRIMDKVEISYRMTGLAVGTAMAGVLLAGCATNAAPRADLAAAQAVEAMAEGRHDRALRLAEQAVEAEPRNAAYRATLGKAYLDAGRFASAEATFTDAMLLGDNSPRTALSLALALTAQAKYTEAAALLNDWEGQIATADLGLALALAGQPDRGVHLMSNAIRGGEDTVKMRQNLAFAYAVAGRWREARVMASQDLPASEVSSRMEQWAAMASADAYQTRVARLLGVPAGVSDAGQPVHLALSANPGPDQLAAEATALAAAAPAPMAPVQAAFPGSQSATGMTVPVTSRELPAVGAPALALDSFAAREPARANTFAQAFAADTAASPMQDARSFAAPASAPSPSASPVAPSGRYASLAQAPVVTGEAPARAATSPRVSGAARTAAPVAPEGSISRTAADGSHLVQLGSFSSEQGARRAWGIYVRRYPELANHEMVITEAVVNGRRYFRVSAGGFDRNASRSMCGRVNAAGGDGCISWAASSPLPGAVDRGIRMARR